MPEPTAKKAAASPKTTPAPPAHDSLEAALVALQAVLPVVPKRHTARIRGRDGQEGYSYQYADLADVSEAAMPLLTSHGLAFVCVPRRTEAGQYELQGRLSHVSGVGGDADGVLTGALPVVGRDAQAIGSSLTYGRRYLLGTMTGLVTDEDDDGAHAAAAKDQRTQTEPAPNDPEVYAPNGQPWRNADGTANADALEPHQRSVFDMVGTLTTDEAKDVTAWWASNQVPSTRFLNPDQAQRVLSYLQTVVDSRPPA